MTELLKDLLKTRAHDARAPHVDLNAVIAHGNRRIRRRRVTSGLAASVAIAAIALTAPTVVDGVTGGGDDHNSTQEVAQSGAFSTRVPTYSFGSRIHYGDDVLNLSPYEVAAFVQTDDGFVVVTEQDQVVFSDGVSTEQIGTTDLPYGRLLAADDSGSYVAWVDTAASPVPQFVVYDTAAGEEAVRTAEGNVAITDDTGEFDLPTVLAIDGPMSYWHNSEGVVAWDIATGTGSLIKPGANSRWLSDVAAGQLAHSTVNDQSIVVNANPTADNPSFDGSHAVLSPDAHFVYTDDTDVARVFDVETGKDVTPTHRGYPFIAVTQWINGTTFAALGLSGAAETSPLDLLECSVSTRECSTAALGVGTVGHVQFPIGETISN
jgi:hypothetical protein